MVHKNNLRNYTILHTEASNGWGGQEIRIITEAEGLIKRGHRVIITASAESQIIKEAKASGIETELLSMKRASILFSIWRLLNIINKYNIDIVNTHSSWDSWLGSIAGRLSGKKPFVIRTRHLSTPIGNNFMSRIVYDYLPDMIITTGEAIRNNMINKNHFNPDKILSIPTGIDLDKFNNEGEGTNLRNALNVTERVPLIGMVSVLRSWKGHLYLLEAIPEVIKAFPDARFIITGDGPYKDVIEEKIRAMDIQRYIIMTGYRDDIPAILSAIDLLVFPSYANEGVPQAVLQAFAMGKTVIASDVGSVSEVVLDYETGILVSPCNSKALAENIIGLLKDKDKKEKMAAAGRRLVEAQYSLEKMLDRTELLYNELMAQKGSRFNA